MNSPVLERSAAWQSGYNARFGPAKAMLNPYSLYDQPTEYRDWLDGFKTAHAELDDD